MSSSVNETKSHVVKLLSLCLVRWALSGGRPREPQQSDDGSSYCHGSVFQQHNPVRN